MDDFDNTRIDFFGDPIDQNNDGVHVKSESMLCEPNEYPYLPSHEKVYGNIVCAQIDIIRESPEEITDFVFANTHQMLAKYVTIYCSVGDSATYHVQDQ